MVDSGACVLCETLRQFVTNIDGQLCVFVFDTNPCVVSLSLQLCDLLLLLQKLLPAHIHLLR